MAKWFVAAKRADFDKIASDFGISPVLARIIRNRDIVEERDISMFLNGTLEDLYDPFLMKDMDLGTGIIQEKIRQQKKIRIIGDYDIDGVCATYILLKGLRLAGADVDAAIPHRMKDGYGINENLIREAQEVGVDTIITCDNGIAARDAISVAKNLGMTVIITDHHEIPYEESETEEHGRQRRYLLPPADAVINPHQEDCAYPFQGICGAAVAYKFILALHSQMSGLSASEKQELLGFAAFATIGDVMELRDENRIMVRYGLRYLTETTNHGMRALIEANGLNEMPLTVYHVGFILGPCLNATGRLDTARRALELFLTESMRESKMAASELKEMNDSRKQMTVDGLQKAIEMAESGDYQNDRVLVIYLPALHESLAGIIAGRLRERYGKPSFVLTDGEDMVKGSGRSIEAYHMYENLCQVQELLHKFGGHKLAAGLSLLQSNVETFRQRLNESCELTKEDMIEKVSIDVPMPVRYATMPFIKELEKLEPFGMGNPKPLFAHKNIVLLRGKVLGKDKNVLKITVSDEEGQQREAIFFGDTGLFERDMDTRYGNGAFERFLSGGNGQCRMHIVYYPDINEFRGNRSIQIVIKHYQFPE